MLSVLLIGKVAQETGLFNLLSSQIVGEANDILVH